MSTENENVVPGATEEAAAQPSYLDMSDEELLNAPAPVFEVEASKEVIEDKPEEGEEADLEDDAAASGSPAARKEGQAPELNEDGTPKAVKAPKDAPADKDKPKPADKVAEGEKTEVDKPKEAPAIDYKAEYERFMAPFKANGREIKVETAADAVALMQMGANYNKKMAALKPTMKLVKMLESSGFLSEEKLGYLIDLGKNDPAAINKLVKDSGLDPMDLDADKAGDYKQKTYAADDREIELDTVLEELQGSTTYTRTLDIVSNKFDAQSKQAVSQSPQLLKLMNDHVASGIYDLISTEVERERMFGRLSGMSTLEAYKQVGDAINARGGFNHLAPQPEVKKPETPPVVVVPKPKVEDDKLKDKKRAAAASTPAAPSSTPADFNPLGLSDADFEKLARPRFK